MTEDSHRIVVGVDGSDASRMALDWAIDEALLRGADLHVVHAWEATIGPATEIVPRIEDPGVVEARAKQTLADVVDAACAHAREVPDRIEATLVRGAAAQELERSSKDALELVVGSHGVGLLAGALLGSVSEHCAEHATTTVTVVPHRRAALTTDAPVAVGVDGSVESRHALRWAATAAGLRRAPLVMVHVYPALGYALAEVSHEDGQANSEALLRDMETTIADVDPAPARIEHLSVPGHAHHVLVNAVPNASLVVVGARGRTGLRRLLGSVSRACTRHASCPVTVVRTADDAD